MRHFSYKVRTDFHIIDVAVITTVAVVFLLIYLGLTNHTFKAWQPYLFVLLQWSWLGESAILFILLGSGLTSLVYFFRQQVLRRCLALVKPGSPSQSIPLTDAAILTTMPLEKVSPSLSKNLTRDSGKIAIPSRSVQAATRLQARYTIRADTLSHTGIVRRHRPNEDSYFQMVTTRHYSPFTTQSVGLFIVADGMGGHNYGQYASTTLIKTIRCAIEADLGNPQVGCEELKKKLIQAIQQANIRLSQERQRSNILCGTTVTGALLFERPPVSGQAVPSYTAHVINVGDSRTYRYTARHELSRITRDHSIVEDLVAHGIITDEDRYTHKDRNKIYRCIGEKEDLDIETFTISLQSGDRLLICSDGLWEMMRDADIAMQLSSPGNEPSIITAQLLQTAINHGGFDNITATVVMLVDEAEA